MFHSRHQASTSSNHWSNPSQTGVHHGCFSSASSTSSSSGLSSIAENNNSQMMHKMHNNGNNGNGQNNAELAFHYRYLKEFRVDQCPLFLQHKCQQHRPFTCFNWHFQNQRRRRPVRRRDGTFNYSADAYCTKYDETTGICSEGEECPFLHRTAGDTERRYHLKYYKTGMCVHDTDNRGYCVKNGPHCAFAHGGNDLRPPVYDIRELQAIENGEADGLTGPNSLDKERSLLNDDPKWLDTTYVLANYKTEPCKKPPRLCRQGYACPQFHNGKDKRRSPKKYKYRSTPCPQVKSGDEWGDPIACEAGDSCQYCHTRTEQQFHPEIYKSTKCNDIQNTSYCPRGPFCAFAHVEQETVSLESPPPQTDNGHGGNLGDLLSRGLPDGVTNCHQALSNQASNDLHSNELSGPFSHRAPGAPLRNGSITPPFEENGVASPIEDMARRIKASQATNNGSSSINTLSTSMDSPQQQQNGAYKNRFLSGDQTLMRQQQQMQMYANNSQVSYSSMAQLAEQKRKMMVMEAAQQQMQQQQHQQHGFNNGGGMFFTESMDSIGNTLDDLNLDAFDPSTDKTRKPSGFSDQDKSRQCSGFENNSKSRNCSGNSITQGLVSAAMLNAAGSNPVMIPGSSSSSGKQTPPGLMGQTASDASTILGVNQLGLFDLTSTGSSSNGSGSSSGGSSSGGGSPKTSAPLTSKDLEIARLREELSMARAQQQNFDERMIQAKQMCEAFKKETAMSSRKVELAMKEKGAAMSRLAQAQKELEMGGVPYLHAIKRVDELKHLPTGVLKSLEWQLKKDLQEVVKAQQIQNEGINNQWMSNNNRMFSDFSTSSTSNGLGGGSDWSLGLIPNQHQLYGSLAQQ